MLRAGLDRIPRGTTTEDRARRHIQHVHELAAQQHAKGGGFIVVSDRDKSLQLLSTPECVYVPLSVCKYGIISRHDVQSGIYTNVHEIENHLYKCSKAITKRKGKKPVSYGQSVGHILHDVCGLLCHKDYSRKRNWEAEPFHYTYYGVSTNSYRIFTGIAEWLHMGKPCDIDMYNHF